MRRLVNKYGIGNGSILLDDLDCSGREMNLLQCANNRHQRTVQHDCSHEEDAGVKCGGTYVRGGSSRMGSNYEKILMQYTIHCTALCEDYNARITLGDGQEYYDGDIAKDDTYYIDDALAIGRIELCLGGKWSAVCENVWTKEDASVACKQLGFSNAGIYCYCWLYVVPVLKAIPHFIRSYKWRSALSIGRRKQ